MIDDPPVIEAIPPQPLSEAAVKRIGESEAVVGAMPFPNEDGVRGFLLIREAIFTALILDIRTDTWRKLAEYDRVEFSIETVFPQAIEDRATWYAETGRLAEL